MKGLLRTDILAPTCFRPHTSECSACNRIGPRHRRWRRP